MGPIPEEMGKGAGVHIPCETSLFQAIEIAKPTDFELGPVQWTVGTAHLRPVASPRPPVFPSDVP